jgi:hypothetical protein
MYLVTSPALVQSAFRSKSLAFEPLIQEALQRFLGMPQESMEPFSIVDDENGPGFISQMVKVIHESLVGEPLQNLNANALDHFAIAINGIGVTFETASLYLWFRDTMTMVITNALLGAQNPLKADPSLIDSLWYADLLSAICAILTFLGTLIKDF